MWFFKWLSVNSHKPPTSPPECPNVHVHRWTRSGGKCREAQAHGQWSGWGSHQNSTAQLLEVQEQGCASEKIPLA